MKSGRMIFSRKKDKQPMNSKEYESLVKKFIEITGDIESLKLSVESVKTDIRSLRGKFNKSLVPEEESESLIKDDGFNFLRKNNF